MTTTDLIETLRKDYAGAYGTGQATAIHLFGIKYAAELEGQPLGRIALEATGRDSYKTEIRKGMNLARFVCLK